jgi:hypothetical protein
MSLGTLTEDQSIEFHDTEEDLLDAPVAEAAETRPQGKMPETDEQLDQWELCSELSDASSFSIISEQTDSSWLQVGDDHPADDTSYLARLMKQPGKFEVYTLPRQQRVPRKQSKKEKDETSDGRDPRNQDSSDGESGQDAPRRRLHPKQKGSWSHKAQEKVARQKGRRLAQSQRDQSHC